MNPGSHEAYREGCRCPMTENQFGRGTPGVDLFGLPQYVTDARCPLHGTSVRWTYAAPEERAPAPVERVVLGVFKAGRLREVVR